MYNQCRIVFLALWSTLYKPCSPVYALIGVLSNSSQAAPPPNLNSTAVSTSFFRVTPLELLKFILSLIHQLQFSDYFDCKDSQGITCGLADF